jgi:hypothetical protein
MPMPEPAGWFAIPNSGEVILPIHAWSAYFFRPLHSKYDAHSDFPGICI